MSRTTVLILAVVSAIFLFFALIVDRLGQGEGPPGRPVGPAVAPSRPQRRGAGGPCWSGTRSPGWR